MKQSRQHRTTRSSIAKKPRVVITLSVHEKEYMENMKKEDLEQILQLFSSKSITDSKPLRMAILESNLPDSVKLKFFNELPNNSSEKYYSLVNNSLQIPMNILKEPSKCSTKVFLKNAIKVMDSHITGHKEAKQEILKFLHNWKHGDGTSNYAISLEGLPGTGKTTFVKHAVSEATGLPMVFIGLGGCHDSSFLMGSSYTYEGSTYGRMVHGLIESKCSNPVFFFDEVDKVSSTPKGDEIINSLIHLIDPAQNSHIRDKYFPFDIDFSKCLFVFAYNDASKISPILLDRIKRIRLNSPSSEEKHTIIQKHIIPKTLSKAKTSFNFEEGVLKYIINKNESEIGMRSIEKDVEHIVSCASLTKSYGNASIIGIDKPYKVSKHISVDFTKDLFKNKEREKEYPINMMYT